MLRQDDYQKSKLVETGWLYGREYGGHLASCMVMSCLMNRVKRGWNGNVLEAIERIPNFSATLQAPQYTMPNMWEPGFIKLLHEVEGIYGGTQDFVKGAVYWCDTRYIDTPFFHNKILGNPDHPRVVEMNSLAFFK